MIQNPTAITGLMNPASDVSVHIDWLVRGPIRRPDGLLAAWVEDGRPSFSYEESSAFFVSLCAWWYRRTGDAALGDEARRTLWTLASVANARGGLGRDGHVYLFDMLVGLRAVRDFAAAFGEDGLSAAFARKCRETAVALARERRALRGGTGPRPERWSAVMNVHHLKVLPLLLDADDEAQISGLFDVIAHRFSDRPSGWFCVDAEHTRIYTHAHAYAVEGIIAIAARTGTWRDSLPFPAVEALARVQRRDGALPRHVRTAQDDDGSREAAALDATAQAARIWQCVDETHYAGSIASALAYLHRRANPAGGFPYADDVPHLNSWTTIFAVQALAWGEGPGESEFLI